jgi:hypothetical protein
MRKFRFITFFLLALAAARQVSAQTQPVLPDHFAHLSKNHTLRDMKTVPPAEYAEIWREAGSVSVEQGEYDSGTAKLEATLEKYRDPTSAYEVYTAYLNPGMHPTVLNRTSAVDGDRMLVLLGSFILQVRPVQAISTADLATFVNSVGTHADPTPLPPIRMYLPKGFLDGTQKYAQGPAGFQNAFAVLKRDEFAGLAQEAGFASGAEAMVAEYRNGKNSAGLLLIEYPTPQLAEQHLKHLEEALAPAAKEAGTTIERKGSLLSLVLRPSSPAFGNALRNELNYQTEVTWNEPRQTISDPPMLSIVGKIIIATLLLMVVAVVLGAAFGGMRVLAKTFFPGKVFDRPDQMDVLQLGLSGKRIDSRDFY